MSFANIARNLQRAMKGALRLVPGARARAGFKGGGGACVAIIGPNGRLIELSGPVKTLFQNASKQNLGVESPAKTLQSLFMPEDQPVVDRAVRSRAVGRIEARARRAGGDAGHFELSFQRQPDGGATVLIIDRTRAEADLTFARRAAEQAGAQSQDSAAMLADLSHEMRTPLNAVIGFSETMHAETFGPLGHPKYVEYASDIGASGRHLLDLVNAILDLAKIEADRLKLSRARTDAALLAKGCADMVRLEAEKAGLQIVANIADDMPDCFVDPRAVRQILINLLSNAVKFTEEGEIRLTVARAGDDILYTIEDNGIGMSALELNRLGGRFTDLQGEGVRGAKGAGLGLSLAFALAELHGGSLDLESAPGDGLTARVRLPIAAATTPAHRTNSAAPGSEQNVLTQLERIDAYRREAAHRRNRHEQAEKRAANAA